MRRLILKAQAAQDVTEAFDWYEKRRTGLGTEFLNEVEKYWGLITLNPELYPSHGNQRVVVMRNFPYKIIYEIEQPDTVVVYAVYHDKRSPEKLVERE